MGIFGGDLYGAANDAAQFHNDFTLTFDGTGETDGGMSFGFHIEVEESNGSNATNGNASYDNEYVFISGAYGTLTLGEIDSAYDKRLTEVALAGGTITDDETVHSGFSGNSEMDGMYDNQILRYDYSFGAAGLSFSMEQEADGSDAAGIDPVYALGFSYDIELSSMSIGLGLGYITQDEYGDMIGVSVIGEMESGFSVGVNYSKLDLDGAGNDWEHFGIGAAYTMDAWTVAANYGSYDYDAGLDESGWGILVNYDLGGGAVIQAGYGSSENDGQVAGADLESWSFGIAMSF
ncbi:Porin [Rhodovulum sp. P5]|nr:Porin [Rhodovulum sp. P5]